VKKHLDLIETLDRLTNTAKELLDICREQAEIIEMHDLVSVDQAMDRRGELEKIRGDLNGMGNV
jgi:hypothetical protein